MKPLIILFSTLLFFISLGYTQEASLNSQIETLKSSINRAQGGYKLELLDSLCWITRDKAEFQYDSIVKVTITLAIELDSFNLANRQAARLIWSLTNRMGRPFEGKSFFEAFDSKKLPVENNALLARFYLNGGDSYYFSENVEKAIEVYNKASFYAIKAKDSVLYGISKKYIADANIRMGNFVEASNLLKEVEAIYAKTKDTIRLVNIKSSRADLYSMNSFYEEAKAERDEVITLAKAIHYDSGLISALINASIDNSKTGNFKQEIVNLKHALKHVKHSEELKDHYEPQILNKLLEGYSTCDSIGKATEFFKELQGKPEHYTSKAFEDVHTRALACYYYAKKDLSKALDYAQKYYDFQISRNTLEHITGAHDLLFKIYDALGDSDKALHHYKEGKQLNDSIRSIERTKVLSYYQTLYETEKRDAKIALKESEIAILDSQNRVKSQWILFGGVGLLALFSIIYLFRSQRFTKNKQQLQEQFSQNLIVEQENERSRLAMELHDSVGQKLMLLNNKTKMANDEDMEALVEGTLEELRSISRGLYPPVLSQFGFSKAISALVDEMDTNSNILFTEYVENVDEYISKTGAIHLYRIVQECLNNTLKHSKAEAVSLNIEKEGQNIHTRIWDNGSGFEVLEAIRSTKNLGMKTLFKRARIIKSKVHIDSVNNEGTTINITTPIYGI
ncbi:MAG: sensor histidine kinase [Bacteroidota bacterium]